MILFYNDWKKYPTAIVHNSTKNKSFIELSKKYKSMGIKNHAFILALINPALEHIDPHDPNLTVKEMNMVAIECKMNFWYYLREVAKAPALGSSGLMSIEANRGNIALFWLFFNHITLILIQIRQTGKTFNCCILHKYLTDIYCQNTQINVVSMNDKLRSDNLEKMKKISASLPWYLNAKSKNDIHNNEKYKISALGNEYIVSVSSKSPTDAEKVGRGFTSPIFQFDEAAYVDNIDKAMKAALSAGTAARTIAKEQGDPYGSIITTTAGDLGSKEGKYIYSLLQKSAIWTEHFFDAANIEELETIIRANSPSKELRVNCTFNHRQLGKTDEWLKWTIEQVSDEEEDLNIDKDFFNIWGNGSGKPPLDKTLINKIIESKIIDPYVEMTLGSPYFIRWYISPEEIPYIDKKHFLIMTLDTSEAVGKDDIAMHLRSVYTGETIAAANINNTNIHTFSKWLVVWLQTYENLVILIERRSTGPSIIDYLLITLPHLGIDPFKRLYNQVVEKKLVDPKKYSELDKPLKLRDPYLYVQYKDQFGFSTSGSGQFSRNDLYSSTLLAAAKYTGDKVRDSTTIDQISSLIVKNERIDHASNGHDDSCIAWLLSYWFISKAKNLAYYGIRVSDILQSNKTYVIENNPETEYEKYYQYQLRQDIMDLVEKMKNEKDFYILQQMETRLEYLSSKLKLQENEYFSLETIINSIKEQKKMNRFLNYKK